MIILGISAYYHDSAAALIKDGVVIAATAEERFNRIKHYKGFPVQACSFCLKYALITIEDIDTVVFYEKPFLKFERIIRTHVNYAPKGLLTFLTAMPIWLKERLNLRKTITTEIRRAFHGEPKRITFCKHHLSHAALAYYTSPYDNCAVLVVDAVGENATTSIFKASKDDIELVKFQQFPHSLGLLYSSFTYYLGFKVNSDEYKVMGLAAYGDEMSEEYKYYRKVIKENLVEIREDGSLNLRCKNFSFMYTDKMVNAEKWEKLFGFPKRDPKETIKDCHKNMALAIQRITEETIERMVTNARKTTGEENLCISGGCGLNSAAIGRMKAISSTGTVYVPFAPGDDGAAIGCALYVNATFSKERERNNNPYLGPSYSNKEVASILDGKNAKYDYISDQGNLYEVISKEIAKGKIIGWFQGRMEFGARALGNRSILADPRNPKMKDIVNSKVKFRESFRPFAPAVLEEFADRIFEIDDEAPYMSATHRLKNDAMELPAVTHIDHTARVQTVSKQLNEKFYRLLSSFNNLTGCPVLLNTSLNVMGEPIACSPADAYKTFMNSGIDILVINNFIIRKS